jgi:hypothetical protein
VGLSHPGAYPNPLYVDPCPVRLVSCFLVFHTWLQSGMYVPQLLTALHMRYVVHLVCTHELSCLFKQPPMVGQPPSSHCRG